jgi:hypothetical protein
MTSAVVETIVVVAIMLAVLFGVLAVVLHGVAERWAIIGVVASIIGIIVGIDGAIVQHSDDVHGGDSVVVQSPHVPAVPSGPRSPHPSPVPSAGATSLPGNSPLRKNILDMDKVCGDLRISRHAWLPGQSFATKVSGRVIVAPGAAYTWSCLKNGSYLTRKEITHGCQIWYPGTVAYTWNPNNAYSWICA